MTVKAAVTVVREWEILCFWIHMMYTDCRQDYRNQQSSFYRNIWNCEGRCHIHSIRPGFCRLFPLGRFYENGSFKYILQIHECPKTNRSKIKVKKWVDTPDLKKYEKFVNDWHYFLLDVQEVLYNAEDSGLIRNLNLFVVNRFYLKPYDQNQDFYIQFYERLKEGKELLALA